MSKQDFYALTPREFFQLREQHRELLMHRELCHGFTTAAVMNTGYCRPEKPVSTTDFMPNYRAPGVNAQPLTDEELALEDEWSHLVRKETLRQLRETEQMNERPARVESKAGRTQRRSPRSR